MVCVYLRHETFARDQKKLLRGQADDKAQINDRTKLVRCSTLQRVQDVKRDFGLNTHMRSLTCIPSYTQLLWRP